MRWRRRACARKISKKWISHRLRAGQRDQAVQEVKAALLLEKIAEEEKIEVSDEEVEKEIEGAGKTVASRPWKPSALD